MNAGAASVPNPIEESPIFIVASFAVAEIRVLAVNFRYYTQNQIHLQFDVLENASAVQCQLIFLQSCCLSFGTIEWSLGAIGRHSFLSFPPCANPSKQTRSSL